MKKAMHNLKIQFEENPVLVVGVATAALTVVTKMVEAGVKANNSSSWKREVKRRESMSK